MEKSNLKIKDILTDIVFVGIMGGLFVLNIIMPSKEVLQAERRVSAGLPQMNVRDVLSGRYMERFDSWASDSFVLRDVFRGINSVFVFELCRQSDKSGLYRNGETGIGRFEPINNAVLQDAADDMLETVEMFEGLDMNIYYSIIPDKDMYERLYLPGFDIGTAENILAQTLEQCRYIRIADTLDADSYYKTDLHWDQSMIGETAELLLREMGAASRTDGYDVLVLGEFRGVYAGEYALPVAPDMITYAVIEGLKVSYLDEVTLEMSEGAMYDPDRFAGIDPYDFFLRGPQPLVMIENPKAPENRELYMFRDSFGSSLAPLLAGSYSRITLIDLRYIHASMLERYIDFMPGSDVLIVYSSQILKK